MKGLKAKDLAELFSLYSKEQKAQQQDMSGIIGRNNFVLIEKDIGNTLRVPAPNYGFIGRHSQLK